MPFLNAEVSGNVWTAVGNPGSICSKNTTTWTNRDIQKRKVLDQGGSKELPYLAAELRGDPDGSALPLGPVNDGSWGGIVSRTPSNSSYCSSFQAIGEEKINSRRLPELRLSPQTSLALRVRACTRARRSAEEKTTEVACFVSCRTSSASHGEKKAGEAIARSGCVCVGASSSFIQQ